MGLLGTKTFRHGVHPPESKDATSGMPIRQFPFAPLLVIPLVQHMGAPSIPVVAEGEEVVSVAWIAEANGAGNGAAVENHEFWTAYSTSSKYQRISSASHSTA